MGAAPGLPVDSPLIEALFPRPVAAAELRGPGDVAALFPEERAGQERWAPKRIAEFAAGRQCARRVLGRLDPPPESGPLLAGSDRRPLWPPGVAGSISHTEGFTAAVAASQAVSRSLGLDVEQVGRVKPHLWSRILTDAELRQLLGAPAAEQALRATLAFAAKEAYYKCQYGITGRFLDFHEVEIELAAPASAWNHSGLPGGDVRVRGPDLALEGRWLRIDGWVVSGFVS